MIRRTNRSEFKQLNGNLDEDTIEGNIIAAINIFYGKLRRLGKVVPIRLYDFNGYSCYNYFIRRQLNNVAVFGIIQTNSN